MKGADFSSEEALVAGLRARDKAAFRWLYDHYAPALYGVVRRLVADEADAQDVFQNAFVKIWHKIDQYDDRKGRLFTWMLNLTRNTAIDHLRSGPEKQRAKIRSLDQRVSNQSDASQMPTQYDHLGMEAGLSQLKPEHTALVNLVYFKGYTQQEAADALKLPLGTAKTRLRAAIIALRKILKP